MKLYENLFKNLFFKNICRYVESQMSARPTTVLHNVTYNEKYNNAVLLKYATTCSECDLCTMYIL